LALQLLIVVVWHVETSDVDGRSDLDWTWFRGRFRSARLDLGSAATCRQEGSRRLGTMHWPTPHLSDNDDHRLALAGYSSE
jgi:hypothetical protein